MAHMRTNFEMPKHCSDIHVRHHGFIALVEINRPPNNYIDIAFMKALADQFDILDANECCRCIVLASVGKNFCAGMNFNNLDSERGDPEDFYKEALRIFRIRKPIIASIQGAAIGGGLGLALAADFRVGCIGSRFSANFTQLGIHPGFGLSVTLPALVGVQQASLLFYTGRRINGEAALSIGLIDLLVPEEELLQRSLAFAAEMAESAPLAVQSTKATLRGALNNKVIEVNAREISEQRWQLQTEDFQEGTTAISQKRKPVFKGR